MKTSIKIAIFFILFTIGFYFLRTQGYYVFYDVNTLIKDLGGLTYLYSAVGVIFAIFAAFVILFQAERWNNLNDSVKEEVGKLNELWLWSQHLPLNLKDCFKDDIKKYLENLIKEEWRVDKHIKKSGVETSLSSLHNNIYKIFKEAPELMPTTFSIFSDLMKYREKRIHYSSFHLPKTLKSALLYSNVLLILLSLLIGVHNPWLDYIFVISVATLSFVIYQLVEDMDNPTEPGGWHITTKDYEELLAKIN